MRAMCMHISTFVSFRPPRLSKKPSPSHPIHFVARFVSGRMRQRTDSSRSGFMEYVRGEDRMLRHFTQQPTKSFHASFCSVIRHPSSNGLAIVVALPPRARAPSSMYFCSKINQIISFKRARLWFAPLTLTPPPPLPF